MKNYLAAVGACALLFGCGGDGTPPASTSTSQPVGNFNLGCGSGDGGSDQQQQQQQQVSFKNPGQKGCDAQQVEFPKSRMPDFNFDVDCKGKQVLVSQAQTPGEPFSPFGGFPTQSIPIQPDDSVHGQTQSAQQIPSDGKGNLQCWVEYVVTFDGKAQCGEPDSTGHQTKSLDMQASVALQMANPTQFGGFPPPSPSPSPSLSPSPSPSDSPSPSPSVSPSPSPSPSPSASPSPKPSPNPNPSVIPVVICIVQENSCPWVADGQMSC